MNNNWLNYFTELEYRKINSMDDMVEKAKIIIDRVKDKGGFPYTEHLYRVSEKGRKNSRTFT